MRRIMLVMPLTLVMSCSETQLSTESKSSKVSRDATSEIVRDESVPGSSNIVPGVESDPDETKEEEKFTANEPISVGGALLVCAYQPIAQSQDVEDLMIDCQLTGTKGTPKSLSAQFYKKDATDNLYPLTMVSQDMMAFKWLISEKPETAPLNTIVAEIAVDDQSPVTFTATISMSLRFDVFLPYWLGSEPNNLTTTDPSGENCVEFVNNVRQVNHFNFTGAPSGPVGRMNDNVCSNQQRFLCRRIDRAGTGAKWIMTSTTGGFDDHPTACPDGYLFSFPFSMAEVIEVRSLVDTVASNETFGHGVWVNLQDRKEEGIFEMVQTPKE